jgi:hypothetical protein
MRTTPLVGHKAWFGPRRFGWGLSPVTVEGWTVMAVLVLVGLVLRRRLPDRPLLRRIPSLVLVAVAVAKGTAPGGHRAWAALRAPAGPADA